MGRVLGVLAALVVVATVGVWAVVTMLQAAPESDREPALVVSTTRTPADAPSADPGPTRPERTRTEPETVAPPQPIHIDDHDDDRGGDDRSHDEDDLAEDDD